MKSVSERLTPEKNKHILDLLGVEIPNSVMGNGWVTVSSPLREEHHPSFGIDVNTGGWKDHGTDKTGDMVTLVELILGISNKEAIQWIDDQVGIPEDLTFGGGDSTSTEFDEPIHYWKLETWKTGVRERLRNEPDHPLVKIAEQYDCLLHGTLIKCGVGIAEQWGKDWLVFFYRDGCQLYRREKGEKVIRAMTGSNPKSSFYGSENMSGNRSILFVAKSPREQMLLAQLYDSQTEAIGLASGEHSNLSYDQAEWIKQVLPDADYKQIIVVFDCDTEQARQTAESFSCKIAELTEGLDVSVVNIHKASGEKYKDITDCIRDGMPVHDLQALLVNGETINSEKSKIEVGSRMDVKPEDLRLNKGLFDKLPPLVKNYLTYCSPLSDVPDEFLLTPFLAMVGAAIGANRFVKVGGLQIYPTVWTVLFAGSSTFRKSTALSLARKLFLPLEENLRKEYERELLHWEQLRDNAEDNDEPFNDPKPVKKTIFTAAGFSDLTFWEDLKNNGGQVSVVGEFTALWDELNRPRNNLENLILDIFDAIDSVRRNTKNAGDIELVNPVWCIAGATTLDSFRKKLTQTERGSGLLQRILPVCIEERTKPYKALTELQSPNAELYREITERLSKLKSLQPRAVKLSTEAEASFTEWSKELHIRSEKLDKAVYDIGGYTSRLNVYGLKFGLIFQQLDHPDKPISVQNIKAAIATCDWLLMHLLYMLDRNYIFDNYYADRLKIRELIAKQPNQIISRTDLMNNSHFDKERLDRALRTLIDSEVIKNIEKQTKGRSSIKYKLVGTA